MANVKISQLDSVVQLTGQEEVPVVQSGVTKKTTVDFITAGNIGLIDPYSVALGVDAAYQGEGSYNTAIGSNTLFSNTGDNNTAVGANAMSANITGQNNVAVGFNSSSGNTTGQGNVSVGLNANASNQTGDYNTAVGTNALYSNQASNNIAVGNEPLYNNTVGTKNIAVGNSALNKNTTGVATLGTIVPGSGYTSATYSGVSLTYYSGSSFLVSPTADIVVAGGQVVSVTLVTYGEGFQDTTTVLTASIPGGSGFRVPVASLISGNDNLAIGYQALYSNRTGSNNVAVGNTALYNSQIGDNNVAIGKESLYSNIGSGNNAIGYQALKANNGSGNNAIGNAALTANTTGTYNVAIGSNAMSNATTASNNVALGNGALQGTTAASGSNNVAIGYRALYSYSTGANNICIGESSGNGITTGSNNILIGKNFTSTLGAVSNQVEICNGNGSRFYIDPASTPAMKIDIAAINVLSSTAGGVITVPNLAGVGSRTVTASATGALSASSDASLKQEDTTATLPGLAEIMQIQPKAYKWLSDIENRGNDAVTEIGFFANEVAPIIPSAAPKCEDGLYGFYDRSMIAALVNAVKELKSELDALKSA